MRKDRNTQRRRNTQRNKKTELWEVLTFRGSGKRNRRGTEYRFRENPTSQGMGMGGRE